METEVRSVDEYSAKMLGDGQVWHKKDRHYHYHREDGPAIIWNNGDENWWYNNTKYSKPEDMPLNLFLAYVKWELKKHDKL